MNGVIWMWLTWVEILSAAYLIGGSLLIKTPDLQSALFFKAIPMLLGFPLALGVAGKLLGWPI